MKIAHFTILHSAEDSRIFEKQCKTLSKNGHEVMLFCISSVTTSYIKNNVYIHKFFFGRRSFRLVRSFSDSILLFREVLRIRPDYIQIHDPECLWLSFFCRIYRIKVIYDVHEDYALVFRSYAVSRRVLFSFFFKLFEFLNLSFIESVIVATDSIESKYRNRHKRIFTVKNFPILEDLNRKKFGIFSDNVRICYTGNIGVNRGIFKLLDAISESNRNFILELAGNFDSFDSKCLVENHSAYPSIHYHGFVDRSGVNSIICQSSIGAILSLPIPSYVESLPVKLFEYLGSGIPVVVSNFQYWRDLLEGYDCVLFVDPTNTKEIREALEYLFDNPELVKRMGQNGYQAVTDIFSWESQSGVYLSVYNTF